MGCSSTDWEVAINPRVTVDVNAAALAALGFELVSGVWWRSKEEVAAAGASFNLVTLNPTASKPVSYDPSGTAATLQMTRDLFSTVLCGHQGNLCKYNYWLLSSSHPSIDSYSNTVVCFAHMFV
jgi:hypothetical protein